MKISRAMRKRLTALISVTSFIVSFAIVVQAVRFCMGQLGTPLIELLTFGKDLPTEGFTRWMFLGSYYMMGFCFWWILLIITRGHANSLAYMVKFGYAQYKIEAKAQRDHALREAKLGAYRERRREKRLAAQR